MCSIYLVFAIVYLLNSNIVQVRWFHLTVYHTKILIHVLVCKFKIFLWFDASVFAIWKYTIRHYTWIQTRIVQIGYFLIAFETNFRMEGEIRPWVNVACGLTLFLYQTLDAMDGKHARRSRNGTPLGQLFDHGCDALSTPICAIVLCTTLQLGATPTLIYALMGSLIPFFMAQLAESRLGVLEHSIGGVLGVTETQIIAILIHISSAFLPMSFWTTAIGTVDLFGFYQVELQPNTLFVFGVLIPSGVFMVFTTMLSLPLEGKLYLE